MSSRTTRSTPPPGGPSPRAGRFDTRSSHRRRGVATAITTGLVAALVWGGPAGVRSAAAAETGALDPDQPGTVIRTVSGQEFSIENVTTPLAGITPTVGHLLPGAPSSGTAGRSTQFAPPMSDGTSFIDVLPLGGTTGNVTVDYPSLGLPINPATPDAGIADLVSFDLVFTTPMADPTYQVATTSGKNSTTDPLELINSTGPGVTFSNALDVDGNPVTIGAVSRISGFQDATAVAGGLGWQSNSVLASADPDNNYDLLRATMPWITADPADFRMDGTLQVDTGSQPIERVTVTLSSRFFRDTSEGITSGYVPTISVAPVVPTQVSALPRLLPGSDYGDASHHMPVVGTDNLHLGASIVESQPGVVVNEPNSGTPTDNSDAGYDGLTSFSLCDDPGQTPVTSIGPAQAGQTLCTTVAVSGARAAPAFVAGYIDFTGAGNFTDPGAVATATVPSGTGSATLQWTIPATGLTTGDLPIRLRTSYEPTGVGPSGGTPTGEVEDYIDRLAAEDRDALSIDKASSLGAGALVSPGETFDYTLTVTNTSLTAQTGVVLADTLPAGLEYVTTDADPIWSFPGPTEATATIDVPGASSASDPATLTFTLTVQVTPTAVGLLQNIAVLDDQDPGTCLDDPTNLCGVDPGPPTVLNPAGLTVTKANDLAGATIAPGDTFSYTITVTSTLGAVPGVVVADTLPTGLEYVTDGADPRWTFTSATEATATIDVPATGTVTLLLTVQVAAGATGTLQNIAVLDDQDPATCLAEPTGLCGVDPAPPTAANPSDLTVTKTNDLATGTVRVGDVFTYQITVTNAVGTYPAAVITDPLPAGLAFSGPQDPRWTITGNTATATVDVTAGTPVVLPLTVVVTEGATGTVRNVAVARGQDPADCLPVATALCGVDPRPPVVTGSQTSLPPAAVPPGNPQPPSTPAPGSGPLAVTGAEFAVLLGLGGLLVAAGALLVRRRTRPTGTR